MLDLSQQLIDRVYRNDTLKLMRKRSWTIQQLKNAVKKSFSYRQVLSRLNLRILCPNCHSLHPTHQGQRRNN